MGRDVGCHAHSNATGAIDEQVGQGCRQNVRLAQRVVKVVVPINRVFVEVIQDQLADFGEARFGITHSRGVVAIHTAKVALPINQRVAQAEILGHAHHGIIDRGVAVGMVLAQHLTDDTGAFLVRLGVIQPQVVVYGIEDAAVYGLQAIAHIGQRARHDHAHGVIEIGALHFVDNICRADKANRGMMNDCTVAIAIAGAIAANRGEVVCPVPVGFWYIIPVSQFHVDNPLSSLLQNQISWAISSTILCEFQKFRTFV